MIKRNFSRNTNIEDDQRRHLVVMACAVFDNDEKAGDNNMGEILDIVKGTH